MRPPVSAEKGADISMAWSSGIELGPDSCVLVAARRRHGSTDISAAHLLDASTWPSHDVNITSTLKSLRRSARLPRRAALIVWGLSDDAIVHDVTGLAAVRPIAAAGFRVSAVMTAPQALAALARSRPGPDPAAAVAWIALNTWGAAIAIVRNGELLFSRTFDWIYRPGLTGSRDQMLQRYSLVAHLAPELQRGMAAVRGSHGVAVTAAVTCGDLPELRSLTMPLIEELDIEVETLDSTDGLNPVGRAKTERFTEQAPALRIAAAAAVTAPRPRMAIGGPLRAAAAVLLVAALGWMAMSFFAPRQDPNRTGTGRPAAATARQPAAQPPPPVQQRPPSQPQAAAPPAAGPANPPAVPPTPPRPPAVVQPLPSVPPATPPRAQIPQATTGGPASKPAAPPPVAQAPASPAVRPFPKAGPPVRSERLPAPPAARQPAALKDPLPRIDSILIDDRRRLAIVNGRIVRVGDMIGPRVLVHIETDSVVLREPSGLDVRVNLRDHDVSRLPAESLGGGVADASHCAVAALAEQRPRTRFTNLIVVPADVRDWEAVSA